MVMIPDFEKADFGMKKTSKNRRWRKIFHSTKTKNDFWNDFSR